jgi:flagellar basal-body rod modification protein FlgD
MATVSNVTTSGAANSAANTASSTVKLAEDFQQFLTLLTTQLQNQDPLSPMDSTEFTNQLVQFTQVEQQINTNAKLDNLVAMQLASISSVALGYVGMDISYISSDMNYDGETAVDITYALASEAVTSKINIYNESGDLVYSADAPKNTGMNTFTWNGIQTNGEPVGKGTYTVKIDAVDKAGAAIENSTVVTGHVDGIETQNGVVYVLVGERAVPISAIVNANLPGTQNSAANTALGYVGMDVTYQTNNAIYNGTDPVQINYSLLEKASQAKVKIYNGSGTLVYTADVPKYEGANTFSWNGKKTDGTSLNSGSYKVVIEAVNTENQAIDATTYSYGTVDGVETKGGVSYVTMDGISVPVSAVMNAKKPTTTV